MAKVHLSYTMVDGKLYTNLVLKYFSYLTFEFNFKVLDVVIRGNAFYDVKYEDKIKRISISYENIEDFFSVTVFLLQNGNLPAYDDKSKTLHLNKLNSLYSNISSDQNIKLNNEFFVIFKAGNSLERKILKAAKELRLYLLNWEGLINKI